MMKKSLALLLTGMLAFSLTAPAAVLAAEDTQEATVEEETTAEETAAEETANETEEEAPAEETADESIGGILSSLFAEDGPLSELLAEDGPVNGLLAEDGLLGGLLGKDGPLGELIPDGTDINGLISSIGDQLTDANSELYGVIEGVVSDITNEDGSLNFDAIGSLAGDVFTQIGAGADELVEKISAEAPVDPLLGDAVTEAIRNYILSEIGAADDAQADAVQIYVPVVISGDTPDDNTVRQFGVYYVYNYTPEDTELHLASEAKSTRLLTLTLGEDGTYTVSEEEAAEEGDGYEDAVKALCEKIGTDLDTFKTAMQFEGMSVIEKLLEFFEAHPEFTKIEFNGELATSEDLENALGGYLAVFFDVLANAINGEEAPAEEAAAEEAPAKEAAAEEAPAKEAAAEEAPAEEAPAEEAPAEEAAAEEAPAEEAAAEEAPAEETTAEEAA